MQVYVIMCTMSSRFYGHSWGLVAMIQHKAQSSGDSVSIKSILQSVHTSFM